MPTDTLQSAERLFYLYLLPLGWKILGAIVLWLIGGWIIGLLRAMFRKAMSIRHIDPTLARYADSSLSVVLRIILVIALLSVLGVATTSFAALLAAVGVAIGLAWSGLLANFAAGVFLILLRPFRTGDMISAAGVTGEVKEIGLFATTLDTGDNLRTFVGNNKLFSDNIVNYSTNEYRRVDLTAQLAGTADIHDAIVRIRSKLALVPNVMVEPLPFVDILEFTPAGPKLAVRPFCNNRDYWQVYFDSNQAILAALLEGHYPPAAPLTYVQQVQG